MNHAIERQTLRVLIWVLGLMLTATGASDLVAQSPDYNRQVLPILSNHCFACHGPDSQARAADLRLDDIPGLLAAGGEIIVPGKSEESELVRRLLSDDEDELMPPPDHKRPLSPEQIATLGTWIDAGAKTTPHWAFVPPQRPAVPLATPADWVRNPIDAFVLNGLNREGLVPSPEAGRATLLRRLSLDLIGLPPTPAELEAFLSDTAPDAYERQVERLLANPHYGERMALPWLEAARYADSNGFQQDGDTHQYVWRDWVVNALNTNMPFDQFTIEQLAGDLLPKPTHEQQVATGFNRCHLLNGEGGAIPEEQRNVIVFDRVDVTATNWLGLTLACAQCHDHKYDPLTMQDYYSFFAFFNNVPESGVPPGGSQYRIADPFIYTGTLEQRNQLAELEARARQLRQQYERLEPSPETALHYACWLSELESAESPQPPLEGQAPPTAGQVPAEIIELARVPAEQRNDEQKMRLRRHFLDHAAPEPLLTVRRELIAADQARDQFRESLAKVMVMSDARPRETRILQRGNYEMPGDPVTANTPAVLPPLPADAPHNRLGLAQWLVSAENPLVARVQVNRFWQHYWGQGLVKTPENFGLQSEPPRHPELLDWLAVEFRESGWDMKHLHRLIVTSSTYRQSSHLRPELLERDPANEFFARAARFRLSSLLLRDLALAASGQLNLQFGGKPVYPYQPPDIWDSLAITKERDFSYPLSSGPDLYRRSLYTFWRRTVGPGNMFDAGSRQACKVRVTITNTPLHALTTLNDETWVEASRLLASTVQREAGSDKERIATAFERVCARQPSASELAVFERQLAKGRELFAAAPEQAREFIGIGASEVPAESDPIELAALTNVCLTIFNLDEALTRE
ncbi:MAG: DUF1553 domain-containing protein [Planctomycetota bacterium]